MTNRIFVNATVRTMIALGKNSKRKSTSNLRL